MHNGLGKLGKPCGRNAQYLREKESVEIVGILDKGPITFI